MGIQVVQASSPWWGEDPVKLVPTYKLRSSKRAPTARNFQLGPWRAVLFQNMLKSCNFFSHHLLSRSLLNFDLICAPWVVLNKKCIIVSMNKISFLQIRGRMELVSSRSHGCVASRPIDWQRATVIPGRAPSLPRCCERALVHESAGRHRPGQATYQARMGLGLADRSHQDP